MQLVYIQLEMWSAGFVAKVISQYLPTSNGWHLQFLNGRRWLSGSCFVTVPAKISRKKVVLGFASKCNQSWHVFCWRVYQLSNKNITQKDYIQTSAFTYHSHNFLCQMFQYTLRFFQNSSNLKTFTHYNLANTWSDMAFFKCLISYRLWRFLPVKWKIRVFMKISEK